MVNRRPGRSTVHIGGTRPAYTSLASWEAGEQGTIFDLQVAVLSPVHIQELESTLDQIAAHLFGATLFIAEGGTPLAFVDDGVPEPLVADWQAAAAEAPDADRVTATVDAFFADRFGKDADGDCEEVRAIVRSVSAALALAVAKNPAALNSIEWRELEKTLAEAFRGLGFDVTLTPPAKDGGKDIVLRYEIGNRRHTYAVELKHWRSGKKVDDGPVESFSEVVVRGARRGGLIISTSGFSSSGIRALAEVERRRVHGRGGDAVVTICRQYAANAAGLLAPHDLLSNLIGVHDTPTV